MAMYERYVTGFYSVGGVHWLCKIFQEADEAFEVTALKPGDEPLIIEWLEKEKEEVICSSTATLTVVSPGDRSLIDLYAVAPGRIRLDVFRNGTLYWSGGIDPEFYEEPYSETAGYDVSLTFSDLGILDRIPYDLTGRKTLLELVTAALSRSGITYGSLDSSLISTSFTDGTDLTLGALSIPSENFVDEDGVASSWKEVIEGILQPLALKIIQRAGNVYVFDLNGLYTKKNTTAAIEWRGTDAKLRADRVYNDIRVTFSPYSKSKMTKELEYGDTYGSQYVNITPSANDTPAYDSFYQIFGEGALYDPNYISFTIFRSNDPTKCKGLAEIGSNNRYFKIFPMLGGNESEGVMVGYVAGTIAVEADYGHYVKGIVPGSHPRSLAMTTERVYLPDLSQGDQNDNFVKIVMEMLADARYNPFEDADIERGSMVNQAANYEAYKSWGQQAFIPVAIVLYDANGTALYHYHNSGITNHGHPADSVAKCACWTEVGDGWKSGDATFGDAWLAYYDKDLDIVEGCGVLGWKANRQNFGKPWTEGRIASKRDKYYRDENNTPQEWSSFESFKKLPDGQFIPYPPVGGYLEVRVYNGVYIFDDTDRFNEQATGGFNDQGLYSKMRWLLYKAPEVSVVKRTLMFDESEIEDIEYSGVANANAKEDLELETICGTAPSACPTARGIYFRSANGLQIQELSRAGRTDHPEQLLIGTLYSQYAERKTILSGEASIQPGALTLLTERSQDPGTKFLIKGEEQKVREDISVATYVEIRPDEYIGVEA